MLLPGRETERLCCVSGMFWERRPLRSGVPGFLRLPRTVPPVCDGGGLRQQAQELVKQDKQRSVPTVSDREQVGH